MPPRENKRQKASNAKESMIEIDRSIVPLGFWLGVRIRGSHDLNTWPSMRSYVVHRA